MRGAAGEIKIFNHKDKTMKQSKLDLTKKYKSYYTAKITPEIVEIKEGKFLVIEGKGTPGGDEFQTWDYLDISS